jgi:hypothetical protein
MSDVSSTRLADLWTRHLAGETLDAEEIATLADAFSSDEVFRRRVLNDLRLDGALRAEAELRHDQSRMLAAMQELLHAAARSDRFVARLRPRLQSAANQARRAGTAERRRSWARRTAVATQAHAAGFGVLFVGLRSSSVRPGASGGRPTVARRAPLPQTPGSAAKTPAEQVAGIAARGRGPVETEVVDDTADGRRAILVTGTDDPHDLEPGEEPGADQTIWDDPLRARLEHLGYQVHVMSADAVALEDEARRAQLVVLSPSVATPHLSDELVAAPVPMIALESSAFRRLGLTGPVWMRDLGVTPVSLSETIINTPEHPLAAGLSGSVPVLSRRQRLRWGVPGPGAVSIASWAGAPANHSLLFAYERGGATVAGPAPARRVAMFLGNARVVRRLTPSGWRLFDAAVAWSAEDGR